MNVGTDSIPSVLPRLAEVRLKIGRALKDCGREPGDLTLVCVSKTFGPNEIVPVLEAGERCFGENRVQEAEAKWPELRTRFAGIDLHLIGPLQSNKVDAAIALFDTIQTVDRPKIARALAEAASRAGRAPRFFVQINTGSEPQKAGVLPSDADHFIEECRASYKLDIAGLMCIPPVDAHASPHFALLAKIAARNGVSDLSMGMSADYDLAIQLGATFVRVGSAIFGAR